MTSNTYVPNDRVWVLVDGYDWWPARVLSDDEIDSVLGTRRTGCDVAVVFYRGTTTQPSVYELNSIADADHICYFETSSQKAVTLSEDLRAAIKYASQDTNANPLKLDTTMIASSHLGSSSSSNAANIARADRKRSRHEANNTHSSSAKASTINATSSHANAGRHSANRHDANYNAEFRNMSTQQRSTSSNGITGTRFRAGHGAGSSSSVAAGAGQYSNSYRQLSVEELRQLAQQINNAVNQRDVNTLRLLLCKLENVDVYPKDLQKSKIGVAVGGLIGSMACRPLWSLARALISFWARHLPDETLRAIRSLQQNTRDHGKFVMTNNITNNNNNNNNNSSSSGVNYNVNASSVSEGNNSSNSFSSFNNNNNNSNNALYTSAAAPHSPFSPLQSLSQYSPSSSPLSPSHFDGTVRSLMNQNSSFRLGSPASPTTVAASQRSTFYSALCRFLDNPSQSVPTDTQTIERVAREFAKGIISRDDRHILLSRLNNPQLGFVRENLLSGKWDVAQYLQQPDEAFKTQQQKSEETMRLRRRIEAEEAAKRANVNQTSLFICPSCHKNRCHYYEQQTRSADEPTTKFITCLQCKHVWTQE